jgi:5-methylcytosine-specific restriction endonuclease McrBC regulatory subunit McrC
MKLSETIKELLKLYDEHGDVEVCVSHKVHHSDYHDAEPFFNTLEDISFKQTENKIVLDAYIFFNERSS